MTWVVTIILKALDTFLLVSCFILGVYNKEANFVSHYVKGDRIPPYFSYADSIWRKTGDSNNDNNNKNTRCVSNFYSWQ